MIFERGGLQRFRERAEKAGLISDSNASVLLDVHLDAPRDDAILTAWNGERFVAYEKWLETASVVDETPADNSPAIPVDADCVAGECGGTRVWLVRHGSRWFMFVGSRKASGRRHDFASPLVSHAIKTAEEWYGAPGSGWLVEKKGRDGRAAGKDDVADLLPQD
jgi:hypothetical protein